MSSIPPRIPQQAFSSEGTDFILPNRQSGRHHHSNISNFPNDNRRKLVRSSSIERIKQFNTYICSQNFYILPSLIAWLKTSQTVLQSQIEKSIKSLKFIFVSSVLYNLILSQLKFSVVTLRVVAHNTLGNIYKSDYIPAFEMLSIIVHYSVTLLIENVKRRLFRLVMYVTLLLIFLQLATCLFFISKVCLPIGLIFMFVCLYIISHINVSVLFYYLKKQENKLLNEKSERKPRKFILGKKTISNLNLF